MLWLILGLLLAIAIRVYAYVHTTKSALRQAITEAYAKRLFNDESPPKTWIYKRVEEIEKQDRIRYSAYWWICFTAEVVGVVLLLVILFQPFMK